MGKAGGQKPFAIKTVEELEEKVEAYFKDAAKRKAPPTMAGLANALDIDRRTLINYRGRGDEFRSVIAKAKGRIEQAWEEGLFTAKNSSGVQFNLKNNFGWRDKTEQEITGAGGEPLINRIVIDYGQSDA